jgi:thioredoxin-dependent peroxiredoxin
MKRFAGWTLGLMLLGSGAANAELKVGDAAPEFKLPGTDGNTHSLSDLKGNTVVLAWFPKAFTGG